jgi:hypothetical protein
MLAEDWTDDLGTGKADPRWLGRGLIAPRQITLLTGLWKAGKTTLFAHVLHARHAGPVPRRTRWAGPTCSWPKTRSTSPCRTGRSRGRSAGGSFY